MAGHEGSMLRRCRRWAFLPNEPNDWFVCQFYEPGFHRQRAQRGSYSITARFGRDHADSIADLLRKPDRYHRYIIPAGLKPTLRSYLCERHGIWRGSLFPDSAGAAETVRLKVFPESCASKTSSATAPGPPNSTS